MATYEVTYKMGTLTYTTTCVGNAELNEHTGYLNDLTRRAIDGGWFGEFPPDATITVAEVNSQS